MTRPPLSLYIHFPWCIQKCPYCDFNSHTLKNTLDQTQYVQALIDDLSLYKQYLQGGLVSIFCGGGTPSLFSANALQPLFDYLSDHCDWKRNEVTLEANPGTVDCEQFADYHALGINRLSLGVQSFQSKHLQALGRIHNGDDACQAIETIQSVGFEQFNLDLMYGLPGQTVETMQADIQRAQSFDPPHLSWYQLTLEPNTAFAYRPPRNLPDDDTLAQWTHSGISLLTQRHHRYEISAFASDLKNQCQHNRHYWEYGDYLGIGAGAHSKLTMPDHIVRHSLTKHPKLYLKQEPKDRIQLPHSVTQPQQLFEYCLNRFRLLEPIELTDLMIKTQATTDHFVPILEQLAQDQLITLDTHSFSLTDHGLLFYNDVVTAFLPESES